MSPISGSVRIRHSGLDLFCREMAGNVRKWELTFGNISAALNYTVDQNGSFALLYDYPGVQYWKGQSQDTSQKLGHHPPIREMFRSIRQNKEKNPRPSRSILSATKILDPTWLRSGLSEVSIACAVFSYLSVGHGSKVQVQRPRCKGPILRLLASTACKTLESIFAETMFSNCCSGVSGGGGMPF